MEATRKPGFSHLDRALLLQLAQMTTVAAERAMLARERPRPLLATGQRGSGS
jgi:hypothetical protein